MMLVVVVVEEILPYGYMYLLLEAGYMMKHGVAPLCHIASFVCEVHAHVCIWLELWL